MGEKKEKKTSNASWMGEEKTARENSMGKFGKRMKSLNCFIKIARKKGNPIYVRKKDIWERTVKRTDILRKRY